MTVKSSRPRRSIRHSVPALITKISNSRPVVVAHERQLWGATNAPNLHQSVTPSAKDHVNLMNRCEDTCDMKALWMVLLSVTGAVPGHCMAGPQEAERFTHIAGFSLADLPSFEDYAQKLGGSQVESSGDAGEFDTRVCYRSAGGDSVVALFHGEVDWGFSVHVPRAQDKKCPIAQALTADQLNIAGVALGMTIAQYQALTGKPSSIQGHRIKKIFEYTHILTDAQLSEMVEMHQRNGYPTQSPEELRRWDVGITLSATFLAGHLTSFTVDRVETN
jgi:hypothetical protein